MKSCALLSIALLCLACAGEPAPADPPVEQPAAAPLETPAGDPSPEGSDATDTPGLEALVGTAPLAKVISEDWEQVNKYTQMFYDGELEALHANFSAEAKAELSLAALTSLRTQMLEELGRELKAVAFKKEENDGYRAYKRAAKFSLRDDLIEVAWVIAADEKIAGLYITPQRPVTE